MRSDEGLATTIRFIHTNLGLLDDLEVNVGDERQFVPSPMGTIVAEKGIPIFRDPSKGPPCLTEEEKAVIVAKSKKISKYGGGVLYLDWTPDAWEYGCKVADDLSRLDLRQHMTQYKFDDTTPGGKKFLDNMQLLQYKLTFDSAIFRALQERKCTMEDVFHRDVGKTGTKILAAPSSPPKGKKGKKGKNGKNGKNGEEETDAHAMPGSGMWSAVTNDIMTDVFGSDILVGGYLAPEDKTFLTVYLDRYRSNSIRRKGRAEQNLAAIRALVIALLGEDFLTSGKIPADFTPQQARKALAELSKYHECLRWNFLSRAERAAMALPVDVVAPGAFERLVNRWNTMSPRAQAHEWCATALGWMVEILSRRARSPVKVPDIHADALIAFENGKCLARGIANKHIKRLAEMQERDVIDFQRHMEDFAMEFLSTDETAVDTEAFPIGDLDVDLAALREQWNKEKDMGMGEFANKNEQELREYLTIRSSGCPEPMRQWTCENWQNIPAGTDGNFEGAIEFKPMWHQLAAVAAIFKRLTLTDQGDVRDLLQHNPSQPELAPRALRDGWSRVPGTLINDDVGLGKTVTTATWIATVIQLLEVQRVSANLSPEDKAKHRPRCLGETFGGLNEIPSAPHIIVVPNGLIPQWVGELRRFFKQGAVQIVVVRIGKELWKEDVKTLFADGPIPLYRRILLVQVSTFQGKMSKGAYTKDGDNRIRLVFPNSVDFIHTYGFLSAWIDEAHGARTCNLLWHAIEALFHVTLVKVLLTATPLLQAASDLWYLTLLLRPAKLNEAKRREIRGLVIEGNRAKAKSALLAGTHHFASTSEREMRDAAAGSLVHKMGMRVVIATQAVLMECCIRRTGKSLRWDGTPINADIPQNTMTYCMVDVSDEEAEAAGKAVEEEIANGKGFEADKMGKFYLGPKLILGCKDIDKFSPAEPLTLEQYGDYIMSKAKVAVEISKRIVHYGPPAVVPEELHGTDESNSPQFPSQDRFGIPCVYKDFHPEPLKPEDVIAGEKVIIHTLFAMFHEPLLQMFTVNGIKAVSISGKIHGDGRDKVIEEFKNDPTIQVLIMSNVGTVGLNLTIAASLILFDVNWSGVMAHQIYGRIHRRGQKKNTFIIQLVCAKTVEVLLVANGLSKHTLLCNFLEADRNEDLWNLIQNRDSCDNLPAVDALAGFDADARAQAKAAKLKVRTTAGPSKVARPKKGKAPVGEIVIDDPTAAPSAGSSKGKRKAIPLEVSDDSEEKDALPPARKKKGKGKEVAPSAGSSKGKGKAIDVSDDSSSEEEDAPPPAKKKKGKEAAPSTAEDGGSKKRKTLAGSGASAPPSPVKPPAKKSKTDIPASPSPPPPSPMQVDDPDEMTSPLPTPPPVPLAGKKGKLPQRAVSPPSPSPASSKQKGKQRAITPPPPAPLPSRKRKKQLPPAPLPPPPPSLPTTVLDSDEDGNAYADFSDHDQGDATPEVLYKGPPLYEEPQQDKGRWYIADGVAVPDDFPFHGVSEEQWEVYYNDPTVFIDSPALLPVWKEWNVRHYSAIDWDLDSGIPPPVSPSTSLSALSSLPDHFQSTQPSEDDSSDEEAVNAVPPPKLKVAKPSRWNVNPEVREAPRKKVVAKPPVLPPPMTIQKPGQSAKKKAMKGKPSGSKKLT